MRYYVFAVQYNKIVQAENRTVPKAYDKRDDAIAEWHRQLASDMKNETLGWSLCMVINSEGYVEKNEKWIAPIPEPEPEVTE